MSTNGATYAGGAGGVGNQLIQMLLDKGQTKIFSSYGNNSSRAALLKMGLKEELLVNYREAKNFEEEMKQKNGELPFDVAFDLVGEKMSEISAKLLKIGGTYVDVTFFGTEDFREILFDKAATIFCVANYAYGADSSMHHHYHEKLAIISRMVEKGELRAPTLLVKRGLSKAVIDECHHLIDDNQTAGKKIVITL